MASVRADSGTVTVALTRAEKLQALHGDIQVPLAHVVAIEPVSDLWSHLRGIRAPGTGIPRRLLVGTTRYQGGRDFCVARANTAGVILSLRDEAFNRVLVSTSSMDTAIAIAHDLNAQRT